MNSAIKVSISIFFIVFFSLSSFYYAIGFDSDSLGYVYESLNNSYSWDVFWKPIANTYLSANNAPESGSFFATLYRPIGFFGFNFLVKIFGANPIPFNILYYFFHSVVAAVCCYVFAQVMPLIESFILALIFAFHPAHYHESIGITPSGFAVYFFLAITLLFWIRYKQTGGLYWYLFSALFYGASLFSYEQPIIFIGVIALYSLLFEGKYAVKQVWLYGLVAGVYVASRYVFLGVEAVQKEAIITSLMTKALSWGSFRNWRNLTRPFFGLYHCSIVVVGIFFAVLTLLILWGFFTGNKESRIKMLFAIMAFIMLGWPVSIVASSTRFIYASIPFFCFLLHESLVNITKNFSKNYRRYVQVSLLIMLMWSVFFAHSTLYARIRYTAMRDAAYADVAQRYGRTKSLIILGYLYSINSQTFLMQSGVAQGIKIHTKNTKSKIYHLDEARIVCEEKYPDSFSIIPIPQGFRFSSKKPEYLYIKCMLNVVGTSDYRHEIRIPSWFGCTIIHHRVRPQCVTDVSFIFDKKMIALVNASIILSYDPGKQRFVELDKSHLIAAVP